MHIPEYIKDYKVSSKSPTDELLTLGRFFSETGGYASTILDNGYRRIENLCRVRLEKVTGELLKRGAIESEEDLFRLPYTPYTDHNLQHLSIDDLELLYRHYSKQHSITGVNHVNFIYYREGAVVDELEKRDAATLGEQLKKDCCTLIYQNELEYLSFVIDKPIGDKSDFSPLDAPRDYTVSEIQALIETVSDYRTVYKRETLAQYVDYAIRVIGKYTDLQAVANLIAEIAWLNHKGKISCTIRINDMLAEAIRQWEKNPDVPDVEMILPLLTFSQMTKDWSYQRKAQRIINRCYRNCMESLDDIEAAIKNVHVSAIYCTYVTRFSIRKLAARWNELCGTIISSGTRLKPEQVIMLLDAEREIRDYAPVSPELSGALLENLEGFAQGGDLTAELFLSKQPQLGPA